MNEFLGSIIGAIFGYTGNYALSIVLFTIAVKSAILPLSIVQVKSQIQMTKVNPLIKELQVKYKNDKETLNKKIMELYKEKQVNPFAGCLPMLIQLPIIWALFAVLREPMTYVFANNIEAGKAAISQGFLWVKDLSEPDTINSFLALFGVSKIESIKMIPGVFPILTAVLTYYQMDMTSSTGAASDQSQAAMMKNMKIMMPIMMLLFSYSMAAGLLVYWTTSILYSIVQQIFIKKKYYNEEEAK